MELQTSTSHAQSNGNAGDHSTAAIPNNGPTATAGTRTRSISRPEEPQTARSMLKLICADFSFFYAGTNDGTIGPLLPYILRRYKVDSALATVMFAREPIPIKNALY